MRRSTVEETLLAWLNGTVFYRKGNTLRITTDGLILSHNTPMGYIISEEDSNGIYQNFVILTAQDFKSQNNWKTQKRQLANAANKFGYMVLFVPYIDIFMGYENNCQSSGNPYDQTFDKTFETLIKVAKYSQDEDIQTSCMSIINDELAASDSIVSYNQLIEDEFVHAEEILCKYLECKHYESNLFVSLLEPCVDCLKRIINCGADTIFFGYPHKQKWNTQEFIEYTNSIFIREIKSNKNRPIVFKKWLNKKVDKFYNKEAK